MYSVMVEDRRAVELARISSGDGGDLNAARRELDEVLYEPPISEVKDPKQKVLRLLKGA